MSDIVVVRLSSLGDVVLTSSFLASCAEHFPAAQITYVVREDLAAVASALPGVRRIQAVSRTAGTGALLSLRSELRRLRPAHVFDLHHSLRSRVLTLGMPNLRPGFGKQSLPRWLLIHAHRDLYQRWGGSSSMRERMLEPLRRLGLTPRLHPTQLVLQDDLRTRVAARLTTAGVRSGDACVAIAPGARWPPKCWPLERYLALAQRLAADGVRVILVGGKDDATAAGMIALGEPRCIQMCGELDVLETAAVLRQCRASIGNDSGLAHVAEAVGCPTLVLFGPTSPRFGYAPSLAASQFLYQPPPCSPCSKNGSRPCMRPTHVCMENLAVETVDAAARRVLEGAVR